MCDKIDKAWDVWVWQAKPQNNLQDWFGRFVCLQYTGQTTQGKARQDKARQGKARQDKARQGKARQGKARQGKARQDNNNNKDKQG